MGNEVPKAAVAFGRCAWYEPPWIGSRPRKELMMRLKRTHCLWLALAIGLAPTSVQAADMPSYLPHYDLVFDLDVNAHLVRGHLLATWINPTSRPTRQLVFNAHSHYVVPSKDIPLMAKTLELLRVNPSEALLTGKEPFQVQRVALLMSAPGAAATLSDLSFHFEGDTGTSLVVQLPMTVGEGQSVTVALDFTLDLPQKQGRWGQWKGITFLSNWLPVFAVYGEPCAKKVDPSESTDTASIDPWWQPTPFVPWHQPFFNEAGYYRVKVRLPCGQKIAHTGSLTGDRDLGAGWRELSIQTGPVRDFAFLCSGLYAVYENEIEVAPHTPVKVRSVALPEHEFYAREMLRLAGEALEAYSKWFGPYPYPEFTIVESYFGWNGNECSTLVMIDERVFAMPHLGESYVQYLIYHETCHQWWYNVVGTNGYCETWMDEALATYFSHRLLNEKVGKGDVLLKWPPWLEWMPNIRRDDYRSYGMYGSFARGENAPVVQPMEKYGHLVSLFSNCYDKGARIVGMIEDRLGPPAFLGFCRTVYQRYQYRILRVADFQKELEAYTGKSWQEFFHDWIYGAGFCDWAVGHVEVQSPPSCVNPLAAFCVRKRKEEAHVLGEAGDQTRVIIYVKQKADYSEATTVGISLAGSDGYPIRIPLWPHSPAYHVDEPQAVVQPCGDKEWRIEVLLPSAPQQIAIDPDQVIIDRDPANNYWKTPIRWRWTPLYTVLEETDLTNAFDRWNVIFGPWFYAGGYDDPWFTRSTMLGFRAGAYRTQEFSGGVYGGYRTDYNDFVVGVDAYWDHWPDSHFQVGLNAEQRVGTFDTGDQNAFRAAAYGRYVFLYSSSLYQPPAHYLEGFAEYQDNFLPFAVHAPTGSVRYNDMATAGLHYHLDYLTPYWDPEGGFKLDVDYEAGVVDLNATQGFQKATAEFSTVFCAPDLTRYAVGKPGLHPLLEWFADTKLAVRAYGATGLPSNGLYFPLGGSTLFRGFDLAQRQGSTVWVGSAEYRLPIARGLTWSVFDHALRLHNIYGAVFWDIGDAYANGHSSGPVAQDVGAGLRLDIDWFGFVERTMMRFDVAKAVNADAGTQFWFSIQLPY
jgi:hypothetical protein